MNDMVSAWNDFRKACGEDENLRATFESDPRGMLADRGLPVPEENMELEFVNDDEIFRVVLPNGADILLSDMQLKEVVGGRGHAPPGRGRAVSYAQYVQLAQAAGQKANSGRVVA